MLSVIRSLYQIFDQIEGVGRYNWKHSITAIEARLGKADGGAILHSVMNRNMAEMEEPGIVVSNYGKLFIHGQYISKNRVHVIARFWPDLTDRQRKHYTVPTQDS